MSPIHKNLANGRWQKMSFTEQMGNIGSEVNRVINCYNEGDKKDMKKACWRALELIDLTIDDKRWRGRLLEILRLREVFCDLFLGDNSYNTLPKFFKDYFLHLALQAKK